MSRELVRLTEEYRELKIGLRGFTPTQSLAEEFKLLHSLENHLFVEGHIFHQPELLMKFDVIIRQGDEGAESSTYVQGTIQGVERDAKGGLTALLVKETPDAKNHKIVPYHPNITHISVL